MSIGMPGAYAPARAPLFKPSRPARDQPKAMSLTRTLEDLTRRYLPPAGARLAKRLSVGARYRSQAAACREGFRQYGDRYPQRVLFVAGLPKSGTTWVEKMLSSFPGFHELLIPEVAGHELATGGSHDFELPDDMFGRFEGMLVLTKMHTHGSAHNAEVLRGAGVRYVVLFRDLRDVAVSNYFYVCNTPWHPEYPHYHGRSVQDGLILFAERTLPAYVEWVRAWNANRDPERSIVLRYEDLLADDIGCLRRMAALFELPGSDEQLRAIAERNSFKSMSGRRAGPGERLELPAQGQAGDWRNHFTPEIAAAYKQILGDFLVEFGYERSLDW
ncbi:MAG: sulfotransferase domain-containing protein [Phycisphaerales bacterium]|nr:sulfotransferase domain-containing protein [Phycisphaerales bacterium]